MRLVLRSADADLHAADRIGAERLDDGLHAVVTAGAALEPRADLAQLHVDVVVDEDEILGPRVERAAHASHGGPADIHERLGLDEIERVAAPRAACDQRAALGVPRLLELVRELIDDALADVVAAGAAPAPRGFPPPPPLRPRPAPRRPVYLPL